jgi:hypothetical protein
MKLSSDLAHHILDKSLDRFFSRELHGVLNGVSERNSCGRLAIHMESVSKEMGLDGYHADTEYNRKQRGELKTILDDQHKVIKVTCDLILHSRGKIVAADNFIAVEMKKSSAPSTEKDKDRDRLRALTKDSFDGVWSNDGIALPEHVCGYVLGVFMELDRAQREYRLEFYEKGRQTNVVVRSFR